MIRPTGDVPDADDWLQPSIGAASALDNTPCRPPPREFPIGFHVAAPGPSHEPPKRRKPKE